MNDTAMLKPNFSGCGIILTASVSARYDSCQSAFDQRSICHISLFQSVFAGCHTIYSKVRLKMTLKVGFVIVKFFYYSVVQGSLDDGLMDLILILFSLLYEVVFICCDRIIYERAMFLALKVHKSTI